MRNGSSWALPAKNSLARTSSFCPTLALKRPHPPGPGRRLSTATMAGPQRARPCYGQRVPEQLPLRTFTRTPVSVTSSAHLNTEGRVTLDSGSRRKCFWEMLPVLVSTVMTGKPICWVQRSMMARTVSGSSTVD